MVYMLGLPRWLSGNKATCQCRLDPWIRKIPWCRKWPPTPVILPGEYCGEKGLAGYSPWGCKDQGTTEYAHTHTQLIQNIKPKKNMLMVLSEIPFFMQMILCPSTGALPSCHPPSKKNINYLILSFKEQNNLLY